MFRRLWWQQPSWHRTKGPARKPISGTPPPLLRRAPMPSPPRKAIFGPPNAGLCVGGGGRVGRGTGLPLSCRASCPAAPPTAASARQTKAEGHKGTRGMGAKVCGARGVVRARFPQTHTHTHTHTAVAPMTDHPPGHAERWHAGYAGQLQRHFQVSPDLPGPMRVSLCLVPCALQSTAITLLRSGMHACRTSSTVILKDLDPCDGNHREAPRCCQVRVGADSRHCLATGGAMNQSLN